MIIYQVYPRSFSDSNNDGIGDLAGIGSKLRYIKSLGCDALWISPFFKSPIKDFGYDVSDYREVDPMFGTMDDFRTLLYQAKKLDLGIIVDMVLSHTAEEHTWFKQSRDRQNDKTDWYLWANADPDGSPPNNWLSVFGGPAWRWDAERRQYYFHSFLSSQPDLNMHNPAVQQQVLADMKFWLDIGVSGFRFDASNHIFQDRHLRSNPPRDDTSKALHPYGFQKHLYDQGQPETLAFLERIRTLLDEYGAYSLAEVGGHDALGLMGQYTQPNRLHSAYSFSMMGPDSTAQHVRQVISTLESSIEAPGMPCYALSNHDKPRVATRWANGRNLADTAKAMFAMLTMMRGDICLYQGEELGLPETRVPFEHLQDPYGKNFWPKFKGRDGCRTPMPWTSAAHGGFSETEPWLPVDAEHIPLNVDAQESDSTSMLHFARKLLAFRRGSPALTSGAIALHDAEEGVLAFTRHTADQQLLCFFNMDIMGKVVSFPGCGTSVISQRAFIDGSTITLGVSGFVILEVSP